jgi:L-ribulokinase
MQSRSQIIPGVCGVVPGSVHPAYTGVEAGLSAVGDIFEAIARRAGTDVQTLSEGLEEYRAGQTGLMRLSWDNGDRTVLVKSELGGITIGWNLLHTAKDELFAAIEGTAFHTRIILDRLAENGVPIKRVINAGGIPQNNATLNQVYADVLNKEVLVPDGIPTSIGSGIFAQLAADIFPSIEDAQNHMCLKHKSFLPNPGNVALYEELYRLYRGVYFAFGDDSESAFRLAEVLPQLRQCASRSRLENFILPAIEKP